MTYMKVMLICNNKDMVKDKDMVKVKAMVKVIKNITKDMVKGKDITKDIVIGKD